MNKRTFLPLLLFPLVFLGLFLASATSFSAEKIWDAEFSCADADNAGQERPLAAIRISLAEGYHAYAHGSGVDMPTELTLAGPDGTPVSATILYPRGQEQADIFEPDKKIQAYTGTFFIFVQPDPLPASRTLTGTLSLLACSSRNCVPVMDRFSLVFPDPLPPLDSMDWKDTYRELAASGIPAAKIREASSGPVPPAPPTAAPAPEAPEAALKPSAAAADASSDRAPAPFGASSSGAPSSERHDIVSLFPALSGEAPDASLPALSPRILQDALEPTALGTALLLGLLAGLVLNVMPCVLPVLTMKISALLSASGHADERSRIARFREHNLLFAAGILTWFAILALCIGVLGLTWGGLFQDPRLVFGLLLLVFLLALSLFDVFTLPVLDFKIGASSTPRLQAYLTGLVATLLATPCSGPLLGGVLGWSAVQPLPVILAVFLATGLGMALPYLLLVIWPGAAAMLPRPGAWTGVMERLVGFFLMGTSLYLLSILPEELRLSALVVLLVAALGAWIWGRWGSFHASGARRAAVAVLVLLMLGGAIGRAFAPRPAPVPWTPFETSTFRSLWQKEPLFVEFTADWCPSCKVLEHTVLTPDRLGSMTERYGVRLIRVDLTRPDPEAEALLRALDSVSIPVAAIFPAGAEAERPLVLRDLYTADQLEKALETLLPRKK